MKKKTAKHIRRITVHPVAQAVGNIDACKRMRKRSPVASETQLNFADTATMLSAIWGDRMELLILLRQHSPSSIRQLAKQLKREYSEVRADVKILTNLGFLATNGDRQIFVPWDEVVIELPLAHIA